MGKGDIGGKIWKRRRGMIRKKREVRKEEE